MTDEAFRPATLNECKDLERRVDEELNTNKTPGMFGEEGKEE